MPDPLSSAALYGKGVFTTTAVVEGAPFLWEKHWRRLIAHAAKLEIDISEYSDAEVLETLTREIEDAKIKNGRSRITFSDESESEVWPQLRKKETSISIIVAERRETPADLSLTISPHRVNTTSPLVAIKSCNYLEHLLAHKESKTRGFDEAIRLNERGEISSACMANVFWFKGGNLYTPSLKTGCLAGTTREFILENVDCEEVDVGIEELNGIDGIFLTSAGIGVVTVGDFDGKRLGEAQHEIQKLSPFRD